MGLCPNCGEPDVHRPAGVYLCDVPENIED